MCAELCEITMFNIKLVISRERRIYLPNFVDDCDLRYMLCLFSSLFAKKSTIV